MGRSRTRMGALWRKHPDFAHWFIHKHLFYIPVALQNLVQSQAAFLSTGNLFDSVINGSPGPLTEDPRGVKRSRFEVLE